MQREMLFRNPSAAATPHVLFLRESLGRGRSIVVGEEWHAPPRRRRRRGERERERSERRSAQEAEAEREGESGHAAICRKNYRPGLIKLFDRLEADTEDREGEGERGREACLPAAWYYSSAAAAIA